MTTPDDLLDNRFFAAWVADTLLAVSDIDAQQRRGPQRKLALTLAGSRAGYCQGVCDNFVWARNRVLALVSAVVPTNFEE